MPARVLIADKLDEKGVTLLQQARVEVDYRPTIAANELLDIIPQFDGLIVRSRCQVTADVIQSGVHNPAMERDPGSSSGGRLRVVGRAGVGVDNIDVEAATEAGVTVVNAPTGNTMAAAEHTIAMLLAAARHIARADRSVRAGEWQRSRFLGAQVFEKRLGLVGLGRIASQVAARAQGLGMEVVAFDPYVGAEYAGHMRVRLLDLDELLATSDFISLHVPLNEQTRNLIGKAELERCKPGVRIVNCARGGVLDETALLGALGSGQVAAVALDVFEREPPVGSDLLTHSHVVLTPHIAGSTQEAQRQVAIDVAEQVLAVLEGKPARHAINTPIIPPKDLDLLRPFIDLAERLGRFLTQFEPGVVGHLELCAHGPIADYDLSYLQAAAVKGLLDQVVAERVNLVNARIIARQRGITLSERRQRHHVERYENMLTLTVTNGDKRRLVRGSVLQGQPHIVCIDDLWVDFVARGHFLLSRHHDRPGIIGRVGTLLGQNDINIAYMHVGRRTPRGEAIMVLALDEAIPESLFPEILDMPHNYWVRAIEL